MPEALVAIDLRGQQLLIQDGRQLLKLHAQLAEVLRSRLGIKHAQYLATPTQVDENVVRWTSDLAAHAVSALELNAGARQTVERRARQLESDMRTLAAQLASESPTGQFYASAILQILEHATQSPLFSVDGWPIRAGWGIASCLEPPPATDAIIQPNPDGKSRLRQGVAKTVEPQSDSGQAKPRGMQPWVPVVGAVLAVAAVVTLGAGILFLMNRYTATEIEASLRTNERLKAKITAASVNATSSCPQSATR